MWSQRCHVLNFGSRKARCVVRSIVGGEVLSFSYGYDRVYVIHHDLQEIYKKRTPMTILNDSKQLFDAITKCSTTEERRLLIEIAVAREAYEHAVIDHVGLVRSEHMLRRAWLKLNSVEHWILLSRLDGHKPSEPMDKADDISLDSKRGSVSVTA